MNETISIEQVLADLTATELDIERLGLISRNLNLFINDSHGEDRSAFRTDLFKYGALLSQGIKLKSGILKALEQMEDGE